MLPKVAPLLGTCLRKRLKTMSWASWRQGILNSGLRAVTLGSKFILVFFLARLLETNELGVYGLINVTVAVSLYLLGLDFYNFNTREIIAREPTEQAKLIRDQAAFHGLVYLIVLPGLALPFLAGILPKAYVGWFYLVLILEHLTQEAQRIFIALSKPLVANTVLFFRGGSWVYAVVTLMLASPKYQTLNTVWLGWSVGAFAGLLVAGYHLRHLHWQGVFAAAVDWGWLGRGLRVSLPFLAATLALRGIETIDRYLLAFFRGEALVGVYTFYASVANAVQIFVFTGVVMIAYPKIVGAFQRGQSEEYKRLMRSMTVSIFLSSILLSCVVAVGIKPLLSFIGNEAYQSHLWAFWILLASVNALVFSMVPHYALYVRQSDKAIIISSVGALGAAVAANLLLVPTLGIVGTALSTFIGMATLGLSKAGFLLLTNREVARKTPLTLSVDVHPEKRK